MTTTTHGHPRPIARLLPPLTRVCDLQFAVASADWILFFFPFAFRVHALDRWALSRCAFRTTLGKSRPAIRWDCSCTTARLMWLFRSQIALLSLPVPWYQRSCIVALSPLVSTCSEYCTRNFNSRRVAMSLSRSVLGHAKLPTLPARGYPLHTMLAYAGVHIAARVDQCPRPTTVCGRDPCN